MQRVSNEPCLLDGCCGCRKHVLAFCFPVVNVPLFLIACARLQTASREAVTAFKPRPLVRPRGEGVTGKLHFYMGGQQRRPPGPTLALIYHLILNSARGTYKMSENGEKHIFSGPKVMTQLFFFVKLMAPTPRTFIFD